MNLGKLKRIDLRQAWKHEANDFTKWLAEEQNLALLGDKIGFDLKLIQVEAAVGNFSADIVATEQSTGKKIIIENQLEATDHTHLGQIITYASGHDAGVVVWIVRDVREEHRQAINWLNEHTDKTIAFYLVKIELWQIGDSDPAPNFDIICNPNPWARTVKGSEGGNQSKTETQLTQLEFWTRLREYAQQRHTKLRFPTPYPQNWLNVPIGTGEAWIAMTLSSREGEFGVELYIGDNKELYEQLAAHKDEIEKDLGMAAKWMALPGKKASRIKVAKAGDFEQKGDWESWFQWLLANAEKFHSVFPKYIKGSGA